MFGLASVIFEIVTVPRFPKKPISPLVGRLIVRPVIVKPWPSNLPVKAVVRFPMGLKPVDEFQVEVAAALILPARAKLPVHMEEVLEREARLRVVVSVAAPS